MSLVTLVENAGRKFEAGDFSEAVALYNDALELKPNCLEALLGLGTKQIGMHGHPNAFVFRCGL